jgi:hypothetical protein
MNAGVDSRVFHILRVFFRVQCIGRVTNAGTCARRGEILITRFPKADFDEIEKWLFKEV